MKGDNEQSIGKVNHDISRQLDHLKNRVKEAQNRRDFLLQEALQNVERISPDCYSRFAKLYKDVLPSSTEIEWSKSKKIGCLTVLGDIQETFDTYLDISDSSVVSSWFIKGNFFNVDLILKLQITKEFDGKKVSEYVSAINEVEFRETDPILTKVAEFLKDSPKYLQMIPSLLLDYKEIQKARLDAIKSLKKKIPLLNTGVYNDEATFEIPLPLENSATLRWKIFFNEMKFNLEDDIKVEFDEDQVHLFSQHKSFNILSMKKLLKNANDVLTFVDSFSN